MKRYRWIRSRRYWGRSLGWVVCCAAILGFFALPGYAQFPALNRAPVVLDGRQLFELSETNQVTAEERAESINTALREQVLSGESVVVTSEVRNKAPVILIDNRYLMTVTQEDAAINGGSSPRSQAKEWAVLLNSELQIAQAERSQAALRQRLGLALGVLLGAVIGHRLMGYFWRRSLRPLIARFTDTNEDDHAPPVGLNLLMTLALAAIRLGFWFGVITYITNLFPVTRRWSYFLRQQALVGFLKPNLRLGQNEFSLLSLLMLVGVLLGLVVVSGIVTNFLRSRILRLTGIDRGSREAISILIKYTLIFVGTVVLLQIWGLDLSSLAIIASALGVGIGLGLQNIAKDFGSGLVLVFERPIQVGDFVEFGEFQGTVEQIGARSTEIKTLDQISIIVPNSRFLEQEVINWSHRNPVSRLRLPVGVAHQSDPEVVRDVLIAASYQQAQVLSKPPPLVFFKGFGENALNFELLVWIADPAKQLVIKSDLYFAIAQSLRQHQIEIPFPQRVVHLGQASFLNDQTLSNDPSADRHHPID